MRYTCATGEPQRSLSHTFSNPPEHWVWGGLQPWSSFFLGKALQNITQPLTTTERLW